MHPGDDGESGQSSSLSSQTLRVLPLKVLGVGQAAHQPVLPSPGALLRPQQSTVVLLHPAGRQHPGGHADPRPHRQRAASRLEERRKDGAGDVRRPAVYT